MKSSRRQRVSVSWLMLVAGSAAGAAWGQVEGTPAAVEGTVQPTLTEQAAAPAAAPAAATDKEVDPEAKKLLDAAVKALGDAKGLQFEVTFKVGGFGADKAGGTRAEVTAVKKDGSWAFRLHGNGKGMAKDPDKEFDVAYFGGNAEWIDADAKKVHVKPVGQMRGLKYLAGANNIKKVNELMGKQPFHDELAAAKVSTEESADVGGVACDVIALSGVPTVKGATVHIALGHEDHLPRRIVVKRSSSQGDTTSTVEFSGLKLNPPITEKDVHVPVPEGFTKDESASGLKTVLNNPGGPNQAVPVAPAAKPGPNDPANPNSPTPTPGGEVEIQGGDPGNATVIQTPGPDGRVVTVPPRAKPVPTDLGRGKEPVPTAQPPAGDGPPDADALANKFLGAQPGSVSGNTPVPAGSHAVAPSAPAAETPAAPAAPAEVTQLPDFELRALDNSSVTSNGMRGSYHVLVFWGSWALSANDALPELQSFATTYGSRNNVRTTTFLVKQKNISDAEKLVKKFGLTSPVVTDADKLAVDLRAGAFPAVFVIGPSGDILLNKGFRKLETFEKVVKTLDEALGLIKPETKPGGPESAAEGEPKGEHPADAKAEGAPKD